MIHDGKIRLSVIFLFFLSFFSPFYYTENEIFIYVQSNEIPAGLMHPGSTLLQPLPSYSRHLLVLITCVLRVFVCTVRTVSLEDWLEYKTYVKLCVLVITPLSSLYCVSPSMASSSGAWFRAKSKLIASNKIPTRLRLEKVDSKNVLSSRLFNFNGDQSEMIDTGSL